MPAKTPIYLKTTTPKKGKRLRLRDVLSGDMISPPLGDVRHSAHVGPEGEGDMFGDVGFLRGKMDMLPSSLGRGQNGPGGGGAGVGGGDGDGDAKHDPHSYAYNGYHYQQAAPGLLKSTVSMPVFIAHEQAPPKPPRLHLDEPGPAPAPVPGPAHPHPTLSLCQNGVVGRLASEPCRDVSLSPGVRRLVPSSGSFSEASSEDSASDTCGPPDVPRGLSLDSDAGLSNEDLRSERSESPFGAFHLAPPSPSPSPSSSPHGGVARSDSMAGLDLDLGPSILEDVLSIMDRYKTEEDNRCEL